MSKEGPNQAFNGLVEDCEALAQQAHGVSATDKMMMIVL